MKAVLEVPRVMTVASVSTDYRDSRPISVDFGVVDTPMHREVDTNIACSIIYRRFAVLAGEPVYVGYTGNRDLLSGIVEVRRKPVGEPSLGKGKRSDSYVGLFRPFDACALRYLFYSQESGALVSSLIHELESRPDVFLMLRRTLVGLKLREGERLEVKKGQLHGSD